MARDYGEANAWDRGLRRFAASGPGSWLFSRTLDHLDRWTFRATRGKHLFSSRTLKPGVRRAGWIQG
jgi:hypothetical protein